MAAVDLTGTDLPDWHVLDRAPAQNRVRMWTVLHKPCATRIDVAQTTLQAAIKGKSAMPPCTTCTTTEAPVSHGMHLACGRAHLIGTACDAAIGKTVVEFDFSDADPDQLMGLIRKAIRRDGNVQRAAAAVEAYLLDDLGDEQQAEADLAVIEKAIETIELGEPDDLESDPAADLLEVVRNAMAGHARSAQVAVGPSEVGGCPRRLGHRVAFGKPAERDLDTAWRPTVGTAVHDWLSKAFFHAGNRWIVDYQVTIPIRGTLDLYDCEDARVTDFKVVGVTTLKKAAKGEISAKYETQLDLYALGMMADGYPVERVALWFLPASGSLADAVWYERPVDIARAVAAVEQLRKIEALAAVAEPAAFLPLLDIVEDFCGSCGALGTFCQGAKTPGPPALTIVGAV